MIKNIDDLKRKMKEDADDFSDEIYKKDFFIYLDGITNNELDKLYRSLPELPQSYTKCLRLYNVFNVSVGYFDLTPISGEMTNIVDSLIAAQSPNESFLPRTILDSLDLYWIGNNNNDTVYVAGKKSKIYQEGEIVSIHEFIINSDSKDSENYRLLLAKDFEQFLIISGNLNEVHRLDYVADFAREEMLKRLKTLHIEEKYHKSWLEYL